MKKEKRYMEKEVSLILKRIKNDIPIYVRIVSPDLTKYIFGEKLIDYIRYPRYRFVYYVAENGHYEHHEVIMNASMIKHFMKYIRESMYPSSHGS
jgi:hypothetical protein